MKTIDKDMCPHMCPHLNYDTVVDSCAEGFEISINVCKKCDAQQEVTTRWGDWERAEDE